MIQIIIVRFALGGVHGAEGVWYYLKVPLEDSISPNETLNCSNTECVCNRPELTMEEDKQDLAVMRDASVGSFG